jgi:formate-dependent nitrite reductase membrane component NrfD
MDLIGIALMVFSMTLLTATVYYVITTTRHKERMALIERGEDVRKIFDQRTSLDALKIGMALVGAGIGFFTGVWLEDSRIFSSHIELPLYFAPIFIFTGLGLVIFYKMFGKQYKIPK